MDRITVRAYAKINLTLDIRKRLPNGYHDLSMVMQSVSLHDTLTAERTGASTVIFCARPDVPTGEKSLIRRAADAFFAVSGCTGGVCFTLDSRIPMQAGLGGGSADCAAALHALNRLYGTGLTPEQLCAIGVRLGADVPFCLCGGTRLAEGIGERLHPLPPMPDCVLLLVKPPAGASTADQFARADTVNDLPHPDAHRMIAAIESGSRNAVAAALGNSFEAVIGLPEITQCKALLKQCGALGSCMSGSGSTVFGLFPDEAAAQRAQAHIRTVRPDDFTAVCRPVTAGCAFDLDAN